MNLRSLTGALIGAPSAYVDLVGLRLKAWAPYLLFIVRGSLTGLRPNPHTLAAMSLFLSLALYSAGKSLLEPQLACGRGMPLGLELAIRRPRACGLPGLAQARKSLILLHLPPPELVSASHRLRRDFHLIAGELWLRGLRTPGREECAGQCRRHQSDH
jgi:hypothetical protein